MTPRQKKLVENYIRSKVQSMLKEESNKQKHVQWFENSAGKSTGMIQLTLGVDSLGNPMINLSSQNAGIHANEVDELISSLKKFKKLLSDVDNEYSDKISRLK